MKLANHDGDDRIVGTSGRDSIEGLTLGDNLIIGNGGQDIIIAGNGNNQIYANTQVDLATALTQQKNITTQKGDVIGVGDGNNTIVGGDGNDAIFTGNGHNTIVCGAGENTVTGGLEVYSAALDWYSQTNNVEPYQIFFWDIKGYGAPPMAGVGNDTIFGGTGNSVYWLSNGNNWLDAGGGNDLIFAGSGSSSIYGGKGNDTIYGGGGKNFINLESGNDLVINQGGTSTIIGGSGNDTIYAGDKVSWASSQASSNNYIYGGSGNTKIFGSGGNDTLISGSVNGTSTTISGGNGNEYIVGGNGNDSILGGTGSDTIYAGDGNTTIRLGTSTSETSNVYGGNGSDTIYGGAGIDVISAGDGGTTFAATKVYAGTGTSTIYGGAGVDQLYGGSGTDMLIAGTGTATLQGGSGNEVMYSSIGNATLIAGSGMDTLYGGSGTDVLQGSSGTTTYYAGSGNETIIGGSGSNTYEFDPGFGNVELQNAKAGDTFNFGVGINPTDLTLTATIGSDGNPALLIQGSNGGQITIDGGLDASISQFTFLDPQTLTLDQMMAQLNTAPATVAGTNGNVMFSASGNDKLIGGTGNDMLYAWNGGNTMVAGTGNQILNSKSGHDTLTGGTGNDTLVSAEGNDMLIGGTGNTTFVVSNRTDTIQATSTGTNTNTLVSSVSYVLPANVQNLVLTGSDNLVASGNDLNNRITANNGNDTLIAGSGIATLIGGTGNDIFVINNSADVVQAQSTGTNTLVSSVSYVMPANVLNLVLTGSDNLVVNGNNLNNTITANNGNDVLIAGSRTATLIGGAGNDTLIGGNTMIAGSGSDQIFAGTGSASIQINPNTVSSVLIGGAGNSPQFLNAFYQSLGFNDWQINRDHPDMYYLHMSDIPPSEYGYYTAPEIMNIFQGWGATFQQMLDRNWIDYIGPLPVTPNISVNDYQALTPYFEQGILPLQHLVAFGQGVLPSDLHLTWGETVGSLSGLSTDPQLQYTTLNISWGTNNQSIRVMIPHTNDPLGSGVSGFTFANGTTLSMGQMIAMAPPAPTFDPGVFFFQLGMGAQLVNGGYDKIVFSASISAGNVQFFQQGADLLVKYGKQSDSLLIQNFIRNDGSQRIAQFQFGDGSQGSYVNNGQGTATMRAYDVNGNLVGDFWQAQDGTYGNDTFNANGSNSGTAYNSDGIFSSYTNDGFGYATTTSYDANGNRSSDSWTKSNGSYGSDTFNANGSSSGTGYNSDGSYNSYTNDGHGNITTNYFDVSGNVLGSSVSTNNGLGDTTATNYDANGIVLSDSWTKADGSYGSDTYNSDGSRISITNDGLGDAITTTYDAVGVKQQDNWTKADGSYGNDTFNADGSSTGMARNNQNESTYTNNGQGVITTIYYSYWTETGSNISTNDGLGDTSTTNYDVYGIKLNHSWAKSDGSHGSDIFNPDGSYSSSANDGHGNVTTQNFDAQSRLVSDQWTHADGSSGTDSFDPVTGQAISSTITAGSVGGETLFGKTGRNTFVLSLGNGQNVIDDSAALLAAGGDVLGFGPGISSQDVSFTQQGADVLVSYSANDSVLIKNFDLWGINGPALIGSCTFADGSSIDISTGLSYDVPGSYSITWYDAHGKIISDMWEYNDGSHGTDIFYTDGSSVGIGYNPDGSYYTSTRDVQGNYAELDFNANGIKTYDYFWHQADGSRSEDTFNADGSSSGDSHNADGSYSNYTNDGHGDVTTNNYDSNGNLARYSTLISDGHGNGTTTNYDASGNVLETIVSTNDGMGSTTTTDYNTVTGEVIGSVATAGAGYSYTYDNTQNVNGIAGETESQVTYTYADGSTYTTDTVYDSNGSYQQSTAKNDGSTTTTDYNAATREVSGSVATAGAGYSYTYDNTQNVNGVAGETESKVTYTYADGSTYGTDTVYEPNGSYQQSTAQSNGSATNTNYNSITGEVSGSVATAGAGYSYTYDNTKNVNGVAGETESKVTYTYADGSTYGTDTIYDPNGSYQQSTVQSNGSTTTTDYNAATGEVSGSVATAGAGYSYTYDNINGVAGETESKVTYTYADGSTYGTDTVNDPNGSYQQSTVQSNGSATTTDYNAATGEVSGSVATAGAGYSYTYDNTKNVNGVAGETESKVTYTYADSSTYATDTVYDPNGSYQQSTVQSNGSATTTDYNAATGEVSGSVATAGAGYSYTYDNTKNVNGVAGETESKVSYTYADGSTYGVDTVYNPDGSYFQGWSKSDGTAGSVAVKANGTLAGDSWAHADGTQGVDAASNQLLMGGIAADTLAGGNGNDILIGGAGNDVITTGAGTNIIAFDKGDGQDVVNATSGQNNTLSLGGSFAYNDLALQKSGNDLILDIGPSTGSGQASDSITFKDWYAGNNNIVDLQMIASAMSDFNPGSTDTLRNTNVENFDFQKLVGAFDQALAANPGITAWGVTNSLLDAHLASSDTAALGGDLAYEYGMRGNLTGFNVSAAQGTLSNSFATAPQVLNPWPTLNTGTAQIK